MPGTGSSPRRGDHRGRALICWTIGRGRRLPELVVGADYVAEEVAGWEAEFAVEHGLEALVVLDGFDDVAVVEVGLDDGAVRALVERLDADRGSRRLEGFMGTSLPSASGSEGIEGAKAEVLQ